MATESLPRLPVVHLTKTKTGKQLLLLTTGKQLLLQLLRPQDAG
jgi:hypothetical protein